MSRRNSCRSCRLLYLMTLALGATLMNSPAHAQFETRATTKLPQGAFSIAAGDFNNDGFADIAVVDDNGMTVSLGKGDGTFLKPVFYATQLTYSIAVADFNNDGNLDIVVANLNPSTVDVYLGNGDGTFKPPISSDTSYGSYFVTVGDFNNDGKPDIAIIDNGISILLGNGDGTFQPPNDNSSFVGPGWLAVGDFNNDHNLDVLVCGSYGSSYNIGVLLGNGDGTLQNSITTPVEYVPGAISAGDLNRDGKLDAVLGYDLGGIAVFLGNGDGTFQSPVNYNTTGIDGGHSFVADLNHDGKEDVIMPSGAGIDVFWGNGDGTLRPAQFMASQESGLPALGDLNGDGLPDIVLSNEFYTTTMLNTGSVSFSPTTAPLDFSSAGARTVKLTNTGEKALSVSSISASGAAFKVRDTCGNWVLAGSSCNITILFSPARNGTYMGLVTLLDGASAKPQFISLSGTAQ